jgi:hypothetical protein
MSSSSVKPTKALPSSQHHRSWATAQSRAALLRMRSRASPHIVSPPLPKMAPRLITSPPWNWSIDNHWRCTHHRPPPATSPHRTTPIKGPGPQSPSTTPIPASILPLSTRTTLPSNATVHRRSTSPPGWISPSAVPARWQWEQPHPPLFFWAATTSSRHGSRSSAEL